MSSADKPTKKQRQAEQRAAQLAVFKKRQAAQKRNRVIRITLSIAGALALIAIVAVVIVVNVTPKPPAPTVGIQNVKTWKNLEATHVEGKVKYQMTPPAGGPHNPIWLNCGIYSKPVPNENAVHDLEHGAIWITYDPALSAKDVADLRKRVPSTYAVLSPYPGLGSPVAVSAWGAQLKFDSVDDPRLEDFITKYWKSADAPEPGAPCTGGVDGPGKIS
ncbi:MAG TPA: DUF3105 domain-containing protein [Pseudolysinimonas sp.]|nr:DUF3105 domain-containing protein [Pseudolysinimonas sp.]